MHGLGLVTVAVVAVLAFALAVAGWYRTPTPAADYEAMALTGDTTSLYALAIVDDLAVGGDTTVTGALDVTGATSMAGGMTFSDGDLTVADDLIVAAQTALTVTDGSPITPTGSLQLLTAAGEVTPTVAILDADGVTFTTGTMLWLVNTANQTINLADGGNVKLTAAGAMGQYDTLSLVFDGTYWLEVARADN
jgi:hypothetical protein